MHLIFKSSYVRMQIMYLSLLAFLLANSSTLNTRPIYTSETPVHIYQKTRRYIQKDIYVWRLKQLQGDWWPYKIKYFQNTTNA
jgi:hypothetical protein